MSEPNGLSHERWRELIREQSESSQTILAFCRERSVSVYGFYYHKRKMRDESLGKGFSELRTPGRGGIRLVLERGRWQLEIEQGFDAECLRQVLGVLD